MAKFLRSIGTYFCDGDGRIAPQLFGAIAMASETAHLSWMYEHYALPLQTDGIVRVAVRFIPAEPTQPAQKLLDIVEIYEYFSAVAFQSFTAREKQAYYLERLHSALVRVAAQFGWEQDRLLAARQRIIDAEFEFSFYWKRPLASPDRQCKVQALIQANAPARLSLVFFDQAGHEVRRTLLSHSVAGPGAVDFALGKIVWADKDVVQVWHKNGRDYWTCTTAGEVAFHYPRAAEGDPHGEYDLGRMYVDGQWVLEDRERGLQLIRSAAAKGFKHASRYLDHLQRGDLP